MARVERRAQRKPRAPGRPKLNLTDLGLALAAFILMGLTAVPLLYALSLSFSTPIASVQRGVSLLPSEWSVEGYQAAWQRLQLWRPFVNSLIVTSVGTALHVLFCAGAAYALLQRAFTLRALTVAIVALSMSVPSEAIMVPLYIVNRQLGLLNTLAALVIAGLLSGFSIFLLFNYFRGVPRALLDAAKIDGANHFALFFRVVLPVSAPGLAAVGLFEVVARWNQFTEPLLYLTDERLFTVQLALQGVVSENETTSGLGVILPNTRMAAVVIGVGVLILVFPFVQRFFVKGITLGASKE